MRPPASFDARCYHAALFLCPPAFRQEFSREILLVFDEEREDARQAAGLWSFRARMGLDLLATIVRQWLRTGWPIITLLAMLYTLSAEAAIAALWRRVPFRMPWPPPASADADLVMLEMLAAVALLIVAGTIVLTLWFTRPLLYRRRR